MTQTWLIDSEQTVHATNCKAPVGSSTPYIPSRIVRDSEGHPVITTVDDYIQMAAHLAGPDSSGGMVTHRGPSMLTGCVLCVPHD